jgi:ankyrin repeat protein
VDRTMWAVSEGHIEAARTLIEFGANVPARSAAGYTPILLAVRTTDIDLTKLLVGTGANVSDTAADV